MEATLAHSRGQRTALGFGLGAPLLVALIALWQWARLPAIATSKELPFGMRVHRDFDLDAVLPWLPPASLVLAGGALLLFAVAALRLRAVASAALASREALLTQFDAVRRWLPAFMLVQLMLVFVAIAGACIFECLRMLADGALQDSRRMKGVMIIGLLAAWLLWILVVIGRDLLRQMRRGHKVSPIVIMGQQLSEDVAPALWRFVDGVVQRAQAQRPDALLVGLNEGFFVTEHPVELASGKPVKNGRVLYLPVPYLAFMRSEEVAAVIAHELGHFQGEDTTYGLRFAPLYRGVTESILSVSNEQDNSDSGWRAWLSAPATAFGKWMLGEFDHAVQHWSRQRELAADAYSAKVVSVNAAAAALLRVTALHAPVQAALHANVEAGGFSEGVLSMVRRLIAEHGTDDPRQHMAGGQAHPLDTHPPLAQRLRALGVAVDDAQITQAMDRQETGLLAELGLEAAPTAVQA